MRKLLIIHPQKEKVQAILDYFQNSEYPMRFADSFKREVDYLKKDPDVLVLMSTELSEMDLRICLKQNKELLKNRVIIINSGREINYLFECFSYGALTFFNLKDNLHEIENLIRLHLVKRKEYFDDGFLEHKIVSEEKEILLTNNDVYQSEKVDAILNYLTDSLKPIVEREVYMGLNMAIYEMLVNAMEHGNLGIGSDLKASKLKNNTYDDFLAEKVKNSIGKIKVIIKKDDKSFQITIKDEGHGFDFSNFFKKGHSLALNGKGIHIANFFFDKIKYLSKGNTVCLTKYLK